MRDGQREVAQPELPRLQHRQGFGGRRRLEAHRKEDLLARRVLRSEGHRIKRRIHQALTALVIVAVFVMLAHRVVRCMVVRLLAKLTAGLNCIATGDTTTRIAIASRDEIGDLAATANHMSEALDRKVLLAHQIGTGDLTHEVQLASDKDTLGLALQTMVTNLRGVVANVRSASVNVATSSAQLTDTAQSVSTGAASQASSVEEVSASIEESAASIAQNTDNARRTETIAVQELDKIVQQNATASVQMASSAEELSGQADQLQSAIAFFHTSADLAPDKAPGAPARPSPKHLHSRIVTSCP